MIERVFTKDEWFEVCRVVCPALTREEFELMWEDFIHDRAKHRAWGDNNVIPFNRRSND